MRPMQAPRAACRGKAASRPPHREAPQRLGLVGGGGGSAHARAPHTAAYRAPPGAASGGAHQLQSCSMMRRTSAAQAARSLYQAVSALRAGPGSRARGARRPAAWRGGPPAPPARALSGGQQAARLSADQRPQGRSYPQASRRRPHPRHRSLLQATLQQATMQQACLGPLLGAAKQPPWAIVFAAAWQSGLDFWDVGSGARLLSA